MLLAAAVRARAQDPAAGAPASPFLGPDGEVRLIVHPEFRGAPELLEDLERFGIEGLEVALAGPWLPPSAADQAPLASRLVLRGSAEVVARAREVLVYLDAPTPAVVVSLLATEVTTLSRRERGGHGFLDRTATEGAPDTLFRGAAASYEPESFLRAGLTGALPFQGTSLAFANAPDDWAQNGAFELVLRVLAEERQAEFLAWPTVLVMEGETGTIESRTLATERVLAASGDVLDVESGTVETGIVLTVVPVRVARDAAVLDLVADLSYAEPEDPSSIPASPVSVRRRTVATRITLRDRESIVLGGLTIRRRVRTRDGVPVVSKVPLVEQATSSALCGVLESELLLLVRGRVLVPGPPVPTSLPPGEARRLDEEARARPGRLGER